MAICNATKYVATGVDLIKLLLLFRHPVNTRNKSNISCFICSQFCAVDSLLPKSKSESFSILFDKTTRKATLVLKIEPIGYY